MRPGLVVAITIPLVLAVTFLAMNYFGIGLHKISLGSLIIALGLLVDDAIIAVEMMVRKMEEGYDKVRAATFAYEVTAMPMLTGTLITAAGFLPIGMAKSTRRIHLRDLRGDGDCAGAVLDRVGVFRALPRHAAAEGEAARPRARAARAVRHAVLHTFRAQVNWCVEHRWITIGATDAEFALGIVGMGKVQQQFFPDSSRPEILVDLWFPEGTSSRPTKKSTKRVEQRLLKEEGVDRVSTWIGSGVPRFYLPLDQVFPQTNVSQMIVLAKDLKVRETLRIKLAGDAGAGIPRGARPRQAAAQRPAGAYPVQFRVIGPEPRNCARAPTRSRR